MSPYNHDEIESKWQKQWQEQGLYTTPDTNKGKENFYMLTEFSYPSGNLHVGHWYAFAVSDIFARYKRMNGYNVLFPMGFDSFGLPAENAAIKRGLDPRKWTYENMEYMRDQLQSMGAMFDWNRAIATSDPEYYKWTQWMFAEFFKNDLAYRATTKVNWCPSCKTILANEQVTDGHCERCDDIVEQRDQEQWMLRITKYADQLHDDLEDLDWPEEIKAAQRAWIGRSEGAEIDFEIRTPQSSQEASDSSPNLGQQKISVFTTRPDTLFGVTYMVLAPEHPLVQELLSSVTNKGAVEKYINDTAKKSELDRQQDKEKTGVPLEGISAINPANGEEIPVWIADYVLAGYGTGAIMAVPAHDERDFEFATKFDLPIRQVVAPVSSKNLGGDAVHEGLDFEPRDAVMCVVKHWSEDKYLCQQWVDHPEIQTFVSGGIEKGEDVIQTGVREIYEESGYINPKFIKQLGGYSYIEFYHQVKKKNVRAKFRYLYFELTDGEQAEIAPEELEKHTILWKKESELQDFLSIMEADIVLGRMKGLPESVFTGSGRLVNSGEFDGLTSEEAKQKITEHVGGKLKKTYRLRDWGISRQRYWGCPIPIVYDPSGQPHAIPEEHLPWTLPDDVDYTPDGTPPLARSAELKARTEKIFGEGWTPEYETMDTFLDSSWYFYRYLDSKNDAEFCSKQAQEKWMPIDLYMGGAEHTTMHLLYSRFWNKALHDLGHVVVSEPYKKRLNRGLILGPDGNKMSKSKGNVIDPDEQVQHVGADTVRMYLAFMGPYGTTANYPWNPNGVVGIRRFIERVWRLHEKLSDTDQLSNSLHKMIKGVTDDMERYKFNTAISKMMVFVSEAEKAGISKESYSALLQLLSPLAPHVTEELWHTLGETESIHLADWPTYDEALLVEDTVSVGAQVNGKVRATITLAPDATEEEARELTLANENIQKWLDGKEIKKFIYVPGRIISLVV